MNRSIDEARGGLLVVSQFTLYGDAIKGDGRSSLMRPGPRSPFHSTTDSSRCCVGAAFPPRRGFGATKWTWSSSMTDRSRCGSNDDASARRPGVGVAAATGVAQPRRDRHHVLPANIDESYLDGETPRQHAERLARGKAGATDAPDAVVVGSDTIVVVDGDVLGKAARSSARRRDAPAAERSVARRDDGRRGAVARPPRVGPGGNWCDVRALSDDEIERYIDTGEPMDKAGAYGIQGYGAMVSNGWMATTSRLWDWPSITSCGCLASSDSAHFRPCHRRLISRSPPLDSVEHVAHRDARHSIAAILHADRVVLAGLAVCVDDEVVELDVRAGALRIRVSHQTDRRLVERDGHVQRPRVRREYERGPIENPDEISQAAAECRMRRVLRAFHDHVFRV